MSGNIGESNIWQFTQKWQHHKLMIQGQTDDQ